MSGAEFDDSKERKQIMKPRKDKNDKKYTTWPPAALFNFSVGSAAGALKYKKKKGREISDEEKKNDEK